MKKDSLERVNRMEKIKLDPNLTPYTPYTYSLICNSQKLGGMLMSPKEK
jgi:hypothetical protein